MGQAIGCGAHLTRLHRTVSGPFTVEKATPLEVVKELSKEELKKRVLPAIALQKMLLNLP
jgi:tRNA pseudouridine55 synthase